MVSTSASAEFHTLFNSLKADIISCISESAPPTDLFEKVRTLRNTLNTSLSLLPPYDQRQYELQLKELEGRVAELRARSKPRSRFAFKQKLASSEPSTISTTNTPAPALSNPNTTTPVTASVSEDAGPSTEVDGPIPGFSMSSHTIADRRHEIITLRSIDQDVHTISLYNLSHCVIDLRPTNRNTNDDNKDNVNDTIDTTPAAIGPTAIEKHINSRSRPLRSIYVQGLRECVLLAGDLDSSAILHDIHDSLVLLGAHQFRMHTSERCLILLHVTSTPVIEHCSRLIFTPDPFIDPFTATGNVNSINKLDALADFNWVLPGQSPHWRKMSAKENGEMMMNLEVLGVLEGDSVAEGERLERILGMLVPKEESWSDETT